MDQSSILGQGKNSDKSKVSKSNSHKKRSSSQTMDTDEDLQLKPMSGKKKKKLYTQIKLQMEFYFGDANLSRDGFLKKLIDEDPEGYVDLEVFKTFNLIKALTKDTSIIADAISRSEMLKTNEAKTRVRRCTPIQHKDADACTLYVERIPPNATIKGVKEIFEQFGKVDYVNIPRYPKTAKVKGFAFVEFNTPDGVLQACEYYKTTDASAKESETTRHDGTNDEMTLKEKQPSPVTNCKNEVKVSSCDRKNCDIDTKESNFSKSTKRKLDVDDTKPQKKIKIQSDSSSNPLSSPVREKNVTEPSKQDDSAVSDQETMEDGNVPPKSKKKRHRKKKSDIEMPILRVMPKEEWRQYRSRYLNLQRVTMSYLKKEILMQKYEMEEFDPPKEEENKAAKGPSFEPGVILKITMDAAIEDPTAIKEKISSRGNVAYIDAPLGFSETFVRCPTAKDAQALLQDRKIAKIGQVSLLEGLDEEKYWEKIAEDRKVKFDSMVRKKKRGRETLIKKAAKLVEQQNKHIYFNE